MSTSSNASKGSPDDDEGRLDDVADSAADEAVEDEAVEEADSDPDELDEPSDADSAAVPAAAAARASSAKQSGSGRTTKQPAKRPAARPATRAKKDEPRGPIAAIALFVRQVISELRKVVTPTGKELGTYVAVVIVFVLVVMAYVGVLDFAVGKLVLWAFGG